jgi:hypothetical protein
MSNCVVVLNDLETYTGLGGCQLVELLRNEKAIVAQMDDGDDLAALDDFEEGKDFRRWDLEKMVEFCLEAMKRTAVERAAEVLQDTFDGVPEEFVVDGETLAERCDGWVRTFVRETNERIAAFKQGVA